jgi:hypothetical protein
MRIDPDLAKFKPARRNLTVSEPDLDFARAKEIATQEARSRASNSMLLSWNDRKRGKSYPHFECGSRQRPAWVVFAESRGGNLTVDINDGEYTFIYLML